MCEHLSVTSVAFIGVKRDFFIEIWFVFLDFLIESFHFFRICMLHLVSFVWGLRYSTTGKLNVPFDPGMISSFILL